MAIVCCRRNCVRATRLLKQPLLPWSCACVHCAHKRPPWGRGAECVRACLCVCRIKKQRTAFLSYFHRPDPGGAHYFCYFIIIISHPVITDLHWSMNCFRLVDGTALLHAIELNWKYSIQFGVSVMDLYPVSNWQMQYAKQNKIIARVWELPRNRRKSHSDGFDNENDADDGRVCLFTSSQRWCYGQKLFLIENSVFIEMFVWCHCFDHHLSHPYLPHSNYSQLYTLHIGADREGESSERCVRRPMSVTVLMLSCGSHKAHNAQSHSALVCSEHFNMYRYICMYKYTRVYVGEVILRSDGSASCSQVFGI